MSEKLYYGCCGAEMRSTPTTVFEVWPDGRPQAWEIRCPCGLTVGTYIDGGKLDLGLVRDQQLNPDNRFEIFPQEH